MNARQLDDTLRHLDDELDKALRAARNWTHEIERLYIDCQIDVPLHQDPEYTAHFRATLAKAHKAAQMIDGMLALGIKHLMR